MFKVMMGDLEAYNQKADMSKELATYFSPFTPINIFDKETLQNQKKNKENILDVKLGMSEKSSEQIKNLE